jgi:hypothetical protein
VIVVYASGINHDPTIATGRRLHPPIVSVICSLQMSKGRDRKGAQGTGPLMGEALPERAPKGIARNSSDK